MSSTIVFCSLDTCDCKFYYQYDNALPGDERTLSYVNLVQAQAVADSIRARQHTEIKPLPEPVVCTAHAAIGHSPALMAAVFRENRLKNDTLTLAQAVNPAIEGDAFTWEFDDARRNLTVYFTPHVEIDRAFLQAAVDLQFGPDAVTVKG